LLEVIDNNLMNLYPKFVFYPLTDRLGDVLLKGLEDLFLVVVDCDLGRFKVLGIDEQVNRVV